MVLLSRFTLGLVRLLACLVLGVYVRLLWLFLLVLSFGFFLCLLIVLRFMCNFNGLFICILFVLLVVDLCLVLVW